MTYPVESLTFSVAKDFLEKVPKIGYRTILADPPWRFENRTGKVAPEHKRLARYETLSLEEIKQIWSGIKSVKTVGPMVEE